MTKDDKFDEPITTERLIQLQEEAKREAWIIRNNHSGAQSRDFYMGQITAYRNILSLLATHPKVGEPEFMKLLCGTLQLDVAVILERKSVIVWRGNNDLS